MKNVSARLYHDQWDKVINRSQNEISDRESNSFIDLVEMPVCAIIDPIDELIFTQLYHLGDKF